MIYVPNEKDGPSQEAEHEIFLQIFEESFLYEITLT